MEPEDKPLGPQLRDLSEVPSLHDVVLKHYRGQAMTNADLVKWARGRCECDALSRAAAQWNKEWVGPCLQCQCADAIEALEARLATIEAATVERCVVAAKGVFLPFPYRWGPDAMEQFDLGKECTARAIRALAPLDTEKK